MALSTNNIVHYTRTKDSLKGILQGHFQVHYCRESLRLGSEEVVFRVPMVSFCEIPLSQVKDHIEKYGSYGVGLTREWAIKNKLNPVFYIEPDSSVANSYSLGMEYFYDRLRNIDNASEQNEFGINLNNILDFLRYTKLYEGRLLRKENTVDRYRFSEEREWRFVPPPDRRVKGMYFDDDFDDEVIRLSALKDVEQCRLGFDPADIRCIIISSDSEVSEFVNHLRNVYSGIPQDEIDLLMTRIVTASQIREDF